MHTVYLDFETYYDKQTYSLSKMSTQDYITSPKFETIGVSIAVDAGPVHWYPAPLVQNALRVINWEDSFVIAHNNSFDAAILAWRYGIYPKMIGCSMSLATSTGTSIAAGGASLATLAQFFNDRGISMPFKGTEVVLANGKRYVDFTPAELAAYGEYCSTDVRIMREIWNQLLSLATEEELQWQSSVLKMYTSPVLLLDEELLREELLRVQARSGQLRDKLAQMMMVKPEQLSLILASSEKFAQLLMSLGVTPPMKVSAKTGKKAFAFAKTDEEFIALKDHDDEMVVAAMDARLSEKSTTMETRIQRFLEVAPRGPLPMAYLISGAHTHRLSGAGENCFVQDTQIQCYTADNRCVTKKIVDVLLSDLVWDGVEYVAHDGVSFNGFQEVIEYDGLTGTPDHIVFTGEAPYTPLSLFRAMQSRTPIVVAAKPPNRESHDS